MTSVNEVIFFVLLGLFFIIFFLATNNFYVDLESNTKRGIMLFTSAAVFSLFFVGYSQLTGVFKNEGFSSESPLSRAKLCRGGAYMNQGDSERAKFCRKLASTPSGLAAISRVSCGAGFVGGGEGSNFKFTPISNGNWQNERCDGEISCNVDDNGIF